MKDLAEELRQISKMKEYEVESVDEAERIAERTVIPGYGKNANEELFNNRMLPDCYKDIPTEDSKHVRDWSFINVRTMHEETLFFIFYSCPETEFQVNAYNEIVNRGYYFSKLFGAFVMLNDVKTIDNKPRTIIIFDQIKWEKVNREVNFDEKFIRNLESQI